MTKTLAPPPIGGSMAMDPQSPSQLHVRKEVEYRAATSPFYLQPWFPVVVVAGVLLAALTVWGFGSMIGRAREEARRTPPVENELKPEVPVATSDTPVVAGEEVETDEPPTNAVCILQEADGELHFTAGTASLAGHPQLTELDGNSIVSGITSVDDRLRWNFQVEKPGPFRVEASYCAPSGSEGGTFTLTVGELSTKPITVRNTGAAGQFTEERVGFLWVRRAGKHELVLTPLSIIAGQSLMTFKSLRLVPVGGSDGE
jgi:hypothetical protein